MTQPRNDSDQGVAPTSVPGRPAVRGVKARRRSTTAIRLSGALSKVYERDAATQRVLAAGMLLRVREMLLRELDRVLGEFGTSHARYQVLAIVCHAPDGLQLGEIAARAVVHPTTMTSTIDRLVRDGLIERRPDPNDRRGVLAVATPSGHDMYRRGHAALDDIEYGLADVDSAAIKRLTEGLDAVAVVLERENAVE